MKRALLCLLQNLGGTCPQCPPIPTPTRINDVTDDTLKVGILHWKLGLFTTIFLLQENPYKKTHSIKQEIKNEIPFKKLVSCIIENARDSREKSSTGSIC